MKSTKAKVRFLIYSCMFSILITLKLIKLSMFWAGFEILAFPCNQFAGQEPGSNEEIQEVVCTRFKAEFPVFDKVIPHKQRDKLWECFVHNPFIQFQYANWLFLVWQSLKVSHQPRLNWYWQQSVTHISLWQQFCLKKCWETKGMLININVKFLIYLYRLKWTGRMQHPFTSSSNPRKGGYLEMA